MASAQFGWSLDHVAKVQAFRLKSGQGAKTGAGGHLPGNKVQGKIAEVLGSKPGQTAISPATSPDLHTPADFKCIADQVRERSGGIPIGFKPSANRIEEERVRLGTELMLDKDMALDDYTARLSFLGGRLVGNLHGHHWVSARFQFTADMNCSNEALFF